MKKLKLKFSHTSTLSHKLLGHKEKKLRKMLLQKHEEIARAFGLDWKRGAACLSDVANVRERQLLPSV